MNKIILIFFFIASFRFCYSQNLERYYKDPCSECIINAELIDSINYIKKIDSLSNLISLEKNNLSELNRLKGYYLLCLSKYKNRFDSVYKKQALNFLLKSINLDSANWRAFNSIVHVYYQYIIPPMEDLDSAYKYCNLLIKANNTIGDSYLLRAEISIFLNKTENTLNDLKKAKLFKTCIDTNIITLFEGFYYFEKCNFLKYDNYYISIDSDLQYEYLEFYKNISMQLFDYYPFIRDSLIEFLKKDSKDGVVHERLKYLLIDYYKNHNLNTNEIEKL